MSQVCTPLRPQTHRYSSRRSAMVEVEPPSAVRLCAGALCTFAFDFRLVHEKGLEPSRLAAPEPKDVGHAANGCERKHFEWLQASVGCSRRPLARGAGHSPGKCACRSGWGCMARQGTSGSFYWCALLGRKDIRQVSGGDPFPRISWQATNQFAPYEFECLVKMPGLSVSQQQRHVSIECLVRPLV